MCWCRVHCALLILPLLCHEAVIRKALAAHTSTNHLPQSSSKTLMKVYNGRDIGCVNLNFRCLCIRIAVIDTLKPTRYLQWYLTSMCLQAATMQGVHDSAHNNSNLKGTNRTCVTTRHFSEYHKTKRHRCGKHDETDARWTCVHSWVRNSSPCSIA